MSNQRPKRETMTIEEATISNMGGLRRNDSSKHMTPQAPDYDWSINMSQHGPIQPSTWYNRPEVRYESPCILHSQFKTT